ncbi:peptidylprolyl isomerase [Fusobacterium sp.]|uniref:peptidylprolyl isomerase n=1 Tax=Fusobacterium sp. TaxID=68766 RepID=UPI0025B98A6D|nr:peptidylprolyl isomerase [Fusobacterium sp.]
MAIRKFRKHIKPFIWFITVLFILSSGMLAYMNIRSSYDRANVYAFKLDGEKVSKMEVERTKNNLVQGYSRFLGDKLDKKLIEILAFDEVINRNLTLEIADELNIKVPNKEVNAQYDSIEKSIGNKEQFKRMLAAQGYTKKTFKQDIKSNILIEKTFQKIKEGVVPTEEEIQREYENGVTTLYDGKSLDEVRDQLINNLKEQKGMEEYLVLLKKSKDKVKIDSVSPEYEELLGKVEIDKDGFKVTNIDFAKKMLNALYVTNGDKEKADFQVREYYDNQIKIAKEAMKRGIVVSEDLPLEYRFEIFQRELFNNIKSAIKPTAEELKEYFNNNNLKYDIFPSAQAEIAKIQIEPSAEDKEVAKKQAEDILKEVTPENFKEKAEEYSTGPSAGNGGELGWFSKGDMVEPFQKAAFEGEVGKVYPTPVETVFGYHLILVEDKNEKEDKVKASHILISPKISKKTVEDKEKDIENLREKIQKKEIEFKNISKDRTDIVQNNSFRINNAGYISGLGYNEELAKTILDAPINKVEILKIDNEIYIFNKTEDVKYKKAKYEDVKDRVKEDYLNSKAQEEMKKYM